jgi:small subunit ribosomal protein S7
MSRRRRADKREVIPDPKFGDLVLTKFMNSIMKEGKKSAAERIVYGALDQMEKKGKSNPVELFHEALRNVMPALEVRSRRVGGATYQVPGELLDAANNRGTAVKKREDTHRMAEANRAFSHYRW